MEYLGRFAINGRDELCSKEHLIVLNLIVWKYIFKPVYPLTPKVTWLISYYCSERKWPFSSAHSFNDPAIIVCSSVLWLQQVMLAIRAGVNPSGNASNVTSLWDLSSSFFFAGTVITTIGITHTATYIQLHMILQVIHWEVFVWICWEYRDRFMKRTTFSSFVL